MRLAAGWALLLVVALGATQPLQEDATPATTQERPADNSEELPSSLVELVMQLVLDLSRLAMELHHKGGSRTVSARRLNISEEPSLLLTFHRTAEAAAALLTREGQIRHAVSNWFNSTEADQREVAGRAMDYESSAEASASDPLPFTIEPLPPPVVPHLLPISMPPDHTEESSPSAVTDNEVRHEKAQGGHPAGERRQSKKAGEVAERAGEVSRTMVTPVSDAERDDPYGLRFLLRFLEAIHKVVAVVKRLVGRLQGLRDGGGGDGSGGGGSGSVGGRDVSSKHALKHALASTQDLADKVSGLMVAHERVKSAKPGKQKARGQ